MLSTAKQMIKKSLRLSAWGRVWIDTHTTQTPTPLDAQFVRFMVGDRSVPYWPVHPASTIQHWRNILIGVETSPGLMAGCYIQGSGGVIIGDYTQIAPGVGIISSNHSVVDSRVSVRKRVEIGSYCWLGMHSVVLPGVTLGDFTVAAAGAVVTKSFPNGHVIVGGNPARVIREIDPAECVRFRSEHEYHGYVSSAKFGEFRRRVLTI